MDLLFASFFAGMLTILAPCVITLLPVILGGSLGQQNKWRPLIIALSLGVSVIIFTLLLKATTVLLGVPPEVWKIISGGLVLIFGLTMLFPNQWWKLAHKLKLYKSESLLVKNGKKDGLLGAVFLGASLGPVFSSCSPTYTVILAIVLPSNFIIGLVNMIAYSLGLVLLLIVIGYGGRSVSQKFKFAVNPNGWFKKTLGVILFLTGFMVITGLDKDLEAWIIQHGYLGPIEIEQSILEGVDLEQ